MSTAKVSKQDSDKMLFATLAILNLLLVAIPNYALFAYHLADGIKSAASMAMLVWSILIVFGIGIFVLGANIFVLIAYIKKIKPKATLAATYYALIAASGIVLALDAWIFISTITSYFGTI